MPGKSRARRAIEAEATLAAVAHSPDASPAVCKRIKEFALLSATNEEIAAFIGVSLSTFETWLVEKPQVKAALRKGKEMADVRVAGAMHRRAVGFSAKAQKVVTIKGEAHIVDIVEHYPPDVSAGKFWLTNRRAGNWKDRSTPDAGQALDLAALVQALHARRGDDAKVIEGSAHTTTSSDEEPE